MTRQRQIHLHKLADILYRRTRGDSVRSIAHHYDCSDNYIYVELAKANANADVKAEAIRMAMPDDRQMSFDFGL